MLVLFGVVIVCDSVAVLHARSTHTHKGAGRSYKAEKDELPSAESAACTPMNNQRYTAEDHVPTRKVASPFV